MTESASSSIERLQRSISIVHSPLTAWAIFALSLAITFCAYWFSNEQLRARIEEQFEFRAHEVDIAIAERMVIYEQALRSGVGLFNASGNVTRQEWRVFVESLQLRRRLPGIQGMGFAKPVPAQDVDAHTAAVRAEGFGDYRIRPEDERNYYTTILYLEPFDWRNQRAFGYDMWSNDLRRQAMQRARDTGEAATSGIITLMQETSADVQKGFLMYLPVYRDAQVPGTVAERRAQFLGWVYAAFRAEDLMSGILGASETDIAFEVYDGQSLQKESLLFDSDGQLSLLETSPKPLLASTRTMKLQGRPWTVHYSAPVGALATNVDSRQPLYVLAGGIIIDALLFYVLISLHLVNRHAQRSASILRDEHQQNLASLSQQKRLVDAKEKESGVFFELAPEAFLVVEQAGRIIKANRYAHDLFEYEPSTLPGLQITRLLPLSIDRQLPELPATDLGHCDAARRSGQRFCVDVKLVPIDYHGEPHTVVAVRDVSKQKEIERTLAEAKEEAESASRAKSEFVANMSHEIRTPLNAVMGAAQLLEAAPAGHEQKKYMRMIRSSGEALLGVVNDILDFSKIEAGAMELTVARFDLQEMLTRVGALMSVSCGEKDIELVIDVEPTVKRFLLADSLRLQQVLVNLVVNAIKFTDTGEVILSVEADGRVMQGRQHLRFSVRDTGIGMNAQEQGRLFKAFAQADASISRKFGGTGLGLVISSRIVGLMGSHIQLTSQPSAGSHFYFDLSLPVADGDEQTKDALPVQIKNTLVLDDHPAVCASLSRIFESWQWPSHCFTNWQELVRDEAHLEALSCVDVLLIDSDFDGVSAVRTVEQLRAYGLPAHCISVLLLKHGHDTALVEVDQNHAFDGSLVKPVVAALLADALQEADRGRASGQIGVAQEHAPAPAAVSTAVNGVKALLVEDNPFNQIIAQAMLEDMGVRVDLASNGAQALTMVSAAMDVYDLVLMDIQMPVMDGLTAISQLRGVCGFTGPIIAMTASVLNSQREQYLSAGMDALIPKPIDRADLFRIIQQQLSGNHQPEPNLLLSDSVSSTLAFNHQRLEQLARGKEPRLRSLAESLQSIFAEAETTISGIVDALNAEDYAAAASAIHSIKGLAGNYGGDRLAEALEMLERALEEPAPILDTVGLAQSLGLHLDQFRLDAQRWIDEHGFSAPTTID